MKLFTNAKFYSIRKENESFLHVLVDDFGKIVETYQQKPRNQKYEEIDLERSFVYPGFTDTHTHSFEGGLYSLSANLEGVEKLAEIFEILAETKPVSGKIFAYHFEENEIKEKRFPTAEELDRIFPETPVILRRVDGHSCVINSVAARQIPWKQVLPQNFNGHLSGRWNGMAANWFHRDLSDEAIIKIYKQAAKIALKGGHTAVHTMIGDAYSDPKHYELIRNHLDEFSVEFILYPQITDVKKAIDLGAKRIGGCALADGSLGSYTAALSEPYEDRKSTKGILYRTNETWEKIIRAAHENNLQMAVHCIGDAAIEQILTIYEKLQKEDPKDLQHEIIHCELTSDEMLDRIAAAKCSAVMQPMFDRLWAGTGGLYETRLGKERTSRTNRLASTYRRGILLTGGSDWYITDINAMKGIDAATRIHNKNERLTLFQAIEIYTRNAAKLSFDEDRFGTIEIGKEANFTCLKEDVFTSQNIAEIEVKNIFRKGKEIYRK
ncbi:MAG: amidohydrolase [Candidatus Cloacimonetes bacterium]|nr:amidohydrolase [Candidatus Cloacimonadota bacterium]MCF7815010.1 amidohydrolase [Candidatus Cloacimonadota bacterium]MCF7869269.1 amidohydrolase [Candidatus Cloacimonadota bacterium]